MKSFRPVLTTGLLFAVMALSSKNFGVLADSDLIPYCSECDPSIAPIGEMVDLRITRCDAFPCDVTRGYCYEMIMNVKCGDKVSYFKCAASAYFFGYLYPLADQFEETGAHCEKGETVLTKYTVCPPDYAPTGYYEIQIMCSGYGPDGTEHPECCREGSVNVY